MVDLSVQFRASVVDSNLMFGDKRNVVFEALPEKNIVNCKIANISFSMKATEFRRMIKLFNIYIRDIEDDEDDSDE